MSQTEILVVLLVIVFLASLIIWQIRSARAFKNRHRNKPRIPKEDPWDHLSFIEDNSTKKSGLGSRQIKLHRNENWKIQPEIGNYAKAWLKPETNTILFYEGGEVGPDKIIGWFEDEKIANHLRKEGLTSATILSCDRRYCTIELEIIDQYETQIRKKREEDFKAKILKPYKPKSDWTLRFSVLEELTQDINVQLKHLNSEELLNIKDSIHQAIWLEDESGRKISKDCYQDYNSLIRTLRAFYSGLDIKIKKILKANENWELTIGV